MARALDRLQPQQCRTVLDGLTLYARALAPTVEDPDVPINIRQGYHPGLIARITEMHIAYYARTARAQTLGQRALGLGRAAEVAPGVVGGQRRGRARLGRARVRGLAAGPGPLLLDCS